jgi:site-specific DNA-methyltransferase (adenine-specific)
MDFELNKIYYEANRETMARMPDNYVDLVVTSPPYADARKKQYGGIHPDKYIEWFIPIAKDIFRILKPEGSFFLNVGDNTIDGQTHLWTYELPIVLKRELGFCFIDALVWHKKNSPPGSFPNRFKGAWEFVYHFSKQPDIFFNPMAVSMPMQPQSIKRVKREKLSNSRVPKTGSGFTPRQTGTMKILAGNAAGNEAQLLSALPSNVLHLATEYSNKNHSAVFPLSLPMFFIKAFSPDR